MNLTREQIADNYLKAIEHYTEGFYAEAMERGLKRVPGVVSARITAKLDYLKGLGFTRNPRDKKNSAPPPARAGAPAAPHPTPAPAGGQGDQPPSEGAKLASILNRD